MSLDRPIARPIAADIAQPMTGRAGEEALLLDQYPGAAAAYSLRKLRAGYSGPCVRVRRSSDNAEQDFNASGVGDGTLVSFLSGASGFVTTLYDQSGNGRDATQTVASEQPPMHQDENGRWYVDVEETADTLTVGGFHPTSYVEAYSLPSVGGAAIPSQGASGDYAVERPFESWIVYPDTTSQQTKQAIAAQLQTEAMGYADATITSLGNHFRDQDILLAGSAGVENWDISSVTDMGFMFLNTIVSDLSPLSGWDTSSVTSMRFMFRGTNVSDLSPLSGWDTSSVTNMRAMFPDTSVSDLSPLGGWDTSSVTNMRAMFPNTSVSDLSPLGGWDTSSVTDMGAMFAFTSVSDLSPLSEWDTSSVTSMGFMFRDTSVSDLSPLGGWDTSSVTDMAVMFRNTSVSDLSPLGGWDTSSVTDMSAMFLNTSVSDLSPLGGWDTSSVTDMGAMFRGTSVSDLSPLGGWDTSSVTNMRDMFLNTSVSDPSIISGWDVASVTNFTSFLEGAPLDDVPTGDMLAGWIDGSPNTETDLQSGVTLGIPNADYSQMDTGGQDAVEALCSDPPNWTINATNAPANCS